MSTWTKKTSVIITVGVCILAFISTAGASVLTETFDLTASADPNVDIGGISARAIFTLDTATPTVMQIELFNTSTGAPAGFSNVDQLLTGISFDFGHPGYNGDPMIYDDPSIDEVVIGPGGRSINFDNVPSQLGAGDNVSGEWGFGNQDGTGMLTNFIAANRSQATAFTGDNLDGPSNIDGPQGGICTDPALIDLSGTGAIVGSVVIIVPLDAPLSNLDFLYENGVMAEFGSDAAFVVVPEPATLSLLALGGLAVLKRRRK